MTQHLAIVGSVNVDLITQTNVRPAPGETVLGLDFEETLGGKGHNQALAAGRVAPASLVAAVGADWFTRVTRALATANVDVTHVQRVERPTGRASITVTPDGENSIIVAPMANSALTAGWVTGSLDAIAPTIVLMQREIPAEARAACIRWCRANRARLVVNVSPVAGLPESELAPADPAIVNVHEARAIVGARATEKPAELASLLADRCHSAVVTSGADGAWVAAEGSVHHIAAVAGVEVVDTTGAGDEFAGALAAHLARGEEIVSATRRASEAAARVVSTPRSLR